MVYFSRHVEGETLRRTGTAGNCQEGRTGSPGNRSEGPPGCRRETRGARTGQKPSGDPSGSSSGSGPQIARSAPLPGNGGKRSSDRTAEGFGLRRTRSELGPRPDEERDESPERVEAPAKAPSGLSRVMAHLGVAGGDGSLTGDGCWEDPHRDSSLRATASMSSVGSGSWVTRKDF